MDAKQTLKVEDVVGRKFLSKTVTDVQWLPDGSAFTFTKVNTATGEQDIYRRNVETNEETLVLEGVKLEYDKKMIQMSGYQTTGNQSKLLISGLQKHIWRYSFVAPYYLYDITTKKLHAIANEDPNLQNVELSPDNQSVAFVKSSNLYVASCNGGEIKQLTHDGNDDILNGIFDWVYEEEFEKPEAFRWSPDGKKIAFWRTDQTHTKVFTLVDESTGRYPTTSTLRYPKVGERNAIVKIGIVEIDTGKTTWMDIGKDEDIYIPRIDWTTSSDTLCIRRLNRKQTVLEYLFANANTGESHTIMTDSCDSGWIVVNDITFLEKKNGIIYLSEKSGYTHIYQVDYSGKEISQVTSGDWEVSEYVGCDEEGGWVYFYGKKDGPHNEVIYRASLDGSKLETISETEGYGSGIFSPNYKYFVYTHSTASIPDKVFLCDCSGKKLVTLEENNIPAMANYNLNWPVFEELKLNGVTLSSYMVKPNNFDEKKKYPVIVFGYSGPNNQVVVNKWIKGRNLWHSLLVDMGCIVVCVDHRGSSGRGRAFGHAAYGDISKYMVQDQIEAIKHVKSLPFVDGNRVGVWGWSGGGYLTLMLLARGAEHYKCGIAVAPVSDFRNYDTIWTERFMGLLKENEAGYNAANVLTYINNLKGKLLIIHGSGDDNVHINNTYQVVDRLVQANKQFDMFIYPNRNHGIYGGNTQNHLFNLMTNFFQKELNLGKFD